MRSPVVVLLCVTLAGCAGGVAQQQGAGYVDTSGATVIPAGEREPAPAVEGITLDGRPLALADLRGPVVVNFWASWCGPCKTEAPDLTAVAQAYADRGLHVVGVNVKDSRASARTFARDLDLTYPSWFDPDVGIAAQFGGVGPAALPTTLVLDRQHRVAGQFFGAVTAPQLRDLVEALLSEGGR